MLTARDYITKGRTALRKLRGLGSKPSPQPPDGPTPQEEPDAPAPEHPTAGKRGHVPPRPLPPPAAAPDNNDLKEAPPWPPI